MIRLAIYYYYNFIRNLKNQSFNNSHQTVKNDWVVKRLKDKEQIRYKHQELFYISVSHSIKS
jgi:hypothetical protein